MATAPSQLPHPRSSQLAREHLVPRLQSDVPELVELLAQAHVQREQPGDPAYAYLDLCIRKPWGHEYRIYDDALSDAWHLALRRFSATSTHAHPTKETLLICVGGSGWLTRGDDTRIALVPGTIARIAPGAKHCTSTRTGVQLVEFESPRDKLDLVRFADVSSRLRGSRYEGAEATCDGVTPGTTLAALEPADGGPPLARIRRRGTDGSVAFAVESGERLTADPATLHAAIALEVGPTIDRDLAVVTPDTLERAHGHQSYLCIRATGL